MILTPFPIPWRMECCSSNGQTKFISNLCKIILQVFGLQNRSSSVKIATTDFAAWCLKLKSQGHFHRIVFNLEFYSKCHKNIFITHWYKYIRHLNFTDQLWLKVLGKVESPSFLPSDKDIHSSPSLSLNTSRSEANRRAKEMRRQRCNTRESGWSEMCS